jgi:hypothetical protein
VSAATTQSWAELEKANRKRSGVLTAIVCAVLVVLCFWLGFYTPFPPPEAEGILVDFGVTATGQGPRETAVQNRPTPPPPRTEAAPVLEESPTQDLEESVALPEPEEDPAPPQPEPEPEPEPEPVEPEPEPEPVIDERFVFSEDKFDFEDPGQSEGDTRPGGNMGDPSGSESDNYLGQSSGLGDNGVSYGLGGRGMLGGPPTDNQVPERGYLQIEIRVDRSGAVTYAKVDRRKSTIVDPGLIARYERYARQATFQPKSDAPATQVGYIRFTFEQR